MSRSYTDKTLKVLWGRAAGRCAMPACRIEVFADATDFDPIVVIGDIAHMHSSSDRGARADAALSDEERNSYDNLILLCKTCHSRIDGQKHSFPVDRIKEMKAAHEGWVRASLPERGGTVVAWHALYLRGDFPFDTRTTETAIGPDHFIGTPMVVQVANDPADWQETNAQIAAEVAQLLAGAEPFDFRLAVFPLAPVSACIALGYHLTNRPHVQLLQYHRDQHSWAWPKVIDEKRPVRVEGLGVIGDDKVRDVSFLFHLSAPIADAAIDALPIAGVPRVHFRVDSPSTGWLCRPEQITQVALEVRSAFESARDLYPASTSWHLFYAGSAPLGIAIGQQLNPTMSPAIQLYEYRQTLSPPYQASIRLGA